MFNRNIRKLLKIFLILMLSFPLLGLEAIKIAAIYSMSGEAKIQSEEHLIVTRYAIEEINNNGGILGLPVELIEIDNESTGLGSRRAAIRAVEEEVVAVLGPSWSSHALAMAPVLQTAGIPMISPTATNPGVTEIGNYIFRACFIDSFQGEIIARFAREELGAERAVILINSGYVFCSELARIFHSSFVSLGGSIIEIIDYSEDITDYIQMLQNLETESFDLFFLPGYTRDSAQIIKAADELGIMKPFIGGDGWSHLMYNYAGEALHGHYHLTHWDKFIDNEISRSFVEKFSKIYEFSELNAGMALAYDAAYLLFEAINLAGNLNRDEIRDAISSNRNFVGVTGPVKFNSMRNPVKSGVMLQFIDGDSIVVKEISFE